MFARSTGFRMQVLCRQFLAYLSVSIALVFAAAATQSAFAQTATTTTLAITSSGNAVTSVSAGTVVTLTATVVAGTTPVTTGQIAFCDALAAHCEDTHRLAVAQLTPSGAAVFKFRPSGGSHSYKAVFLGTQTYAGSSSSTSSLNVTGPFPSVTQIQAPYQGSAWNLTALVSGALPTTSPLTPSGTVSFVDTSNSNTVLGTVDLAESSSSTSLAYAGALPLTTTNSAVVVPADFNGDGIPDVVVAGTNQLGVALGNGDGTFRQGPGYGPAQLYPGTILVGDFNQDGIPDLAMEAALNGAYYVNILLGNGDGSFTLKSQVPSSNGPVAIGDFNGDGIPDLVVTTITYSGTTAITTVTIELGKGDGTFTAMASPLTFSGFLDGLQVADFNGDGIPDLLVTQDLVPQAVGTEVMVLLGNGDGTFAAKPGIIGFAFATAIADFNDDGFPDLAIIDLDSGSVQIWTGNGDGTFTKKSSFPSPNGTSGIATGDFNGDGIADIALVCETDGQQNLPIYLGNGDGTFSTANVNLTNSSIPEGVGVVSGVDLNGDGLSDLLEVQFTGYVSTYLAQSGRTASVPVVQIDPSLGTHLITASYSGDSNFQPSTSGPATIISQLAAITAPTAGAILYRGNTTFTWSAGMGASQYKLDLGTGGQGSSDLYAGSPTTATSAVVPLGTLPFNGATITATLYSYIDGTWSPVSTTYTEPLAPVITAPTPGSKLPGSTATFTWSPGTGVTAYVLYAGTDWPGSYNVYASPISTATSATATGLPTDGVTVYVALRYEIGGTWYISYYTYTAKGTTAPPVLTTPMPGSKFSSSSVAFTWTPGSGVTQYQLQIGSYGTGYYNIYGSGAIPTTSVTATNLPTDGRTLYVTLFYLIDGAWNSAYYTYTANGSVVPPVMTSPLPGSTLSGSSVAFTWTPGSGAYAYSLSVGTYGPGYFNVYSSPSTTGTTLIVPNIPTNSKPVYVTLNYEIAGGTWEHIYYTYMAQ